jgi:hypothetical protein
MWHKKLEKEYQKTVDLMDGSGTLRCKDWHRQTFGKDWDNARLQHWDEGDGCFSFFFIIFRKMDKLVYFIGFGLGSKQWNYYRYMCNALMVDFFFVKN